MHRPQSCGPKASAVVTTDRHANIAETCKMALQPSNARTGGEMRSTTKDAHRQSCRFRECCVAATRLIGNNEVCADHFELAVARLVRTITPPYEPSTPTSRDALPPTTRRSI